jgi:enoyl-CoA hydratase
VDAVVIEDSASGVRFITINRPDRMNALNAEVLGVIESAVAEASSDVNIGCIVIRGEGDRAFCAGADLGEIRGLSSDAAHAFIRHGQRTMSTIEASPIPVVAAVDGWALGGGFELMLACHLVVASDRSRFGLPEAKIGCIPGFGGTQRLMTAVGRAPGFFLLLTGDPIDADRASAIGLLSIPPVSPVGFDAEVAKLADAVAGGSRTGVRSIIEAGMRAAQPAALEHEAALAALAIASADGQEGIAAFAERRSPNFAREAQS